MDTDLLDDRRSSSGVHGIDPPKASPSAAQSVLHFVETKPSFVSAAWAFCPSYADEEYELPKMASKDGTSGA